MLRHSPGRTDFVQAHIAGCLVTKGSGNTINVSAGYAYVPASGRILTFAGVTNASAGTLGADQWHQVYLYDNAGTPSIQVVNNADAPSTTYYGTARQGGTNNNLRWIGCFKTDASSNIFLYSAVVEIANGYRVAAFESYPTNRVLQGGTSATYALVSLGSAAPRYVTAEVTYMFFSDASTTPGGTTFSLDPASFYGFAYTPVPGVAGLWGYIGNTFKGPVFMDAGIPSVYYKTDTVIYLDILGYEVAR